MAATDHRLLVPALAAFVLIAVACPAAAGRFTWPIRCTQISMDPPRYRAVIGFFDRFDGTVPMCAIGADSTSFYGVDRSSPILEIAGPAWLTARLDPETARAWWTPAECVVGFPYDSISVVTAAPSFCLLLRYFTTDLLFHHVESECFVADAVTPAREETWGRLKAIYR